MDEIGAVDTLITLIEKRTWTDAEADRIRSTRRSIIQMLEIAVAAETLIEFQIKAEPDEAEAEELNEDRVQIQILVQKLLTALRRLPPAKAD